MIMVKHSQESKLFCEQMKFKIFGKIYSFKIYIQSFSENKPL